MLDGFVRAGGRDGNLRFREPCFSCRARAKERGLTTMEEIDEDIDTTYGGVIDQALEEV